jgi:hypothetical protein
MLHADDVHAYDVEEIGAAQVGRQVLLRNLEAHLRRIIVTAREVIDWHRQATVSLETPPPSRSASPS